MDAWLMMRTVIVRVAQIFETLELEIALKRLEPPAATAFHTTTLQTTQPIPDGIHSCLCRSPTCRNQKPPLLSSPSSSSSLAPVKRVPVPRSVQPSVVRVSRRWISARNSTQGQRTSRQALPCPAGLPYDQTDHSTLTSEHHRHHGFCEMPPSCQSGRKGRGKERASRGTRQSALSASSTYTRLPKSSNPSSACRGYHWRGSARLSSSRQSQLASPWCHSHVVGSVEGVWVASGTA